MGSTLPRLDRPDVLTNHNHPQPDADGKVKELWSFRRSNYFEHVGHEIRNVTNNVGLLGHVGLRQDGSVRSRRPRLGSIRSSPIASRRKQGRIALCHLLTPQGGVRSEFTVYEWAPGQFYLVSAGAYENHDHDYLRKLLPADGSVTCVRSRRCMAFWSWRDPRAARCWRN